MATPDVRRLRQRSTVAVLVLVGYVVVASIVGLVVKLPDLPVTHAHTDHITIAEVTVGNGTIMSPPLVLMVVVLLLWWGSTVRQVLVARTCSVLLIVGVAAMTVDEAFGFGNRPVLYSSAQWAVAVVVGLIFVVLGVAVVVTETMWLVASVRSTRPSPTTT